MLKRYDLVYDNPVIQCSAHIGEVEDGNYLRRTDVSAQMVPRPDPAEVRKAVNDLLLAYNRLTFTKVKNQPPDLTAGEFNRGE